MSHQLTVVLSGQSIPSPDAINQELSALDLPCQVSPQASLAPSSGSFSATLTTSSQTCEIQFEDSDWLSEISELRQRAGDRDRCIDFILGSDMVECALVSAIAAALSSLCSAIVYYQPDDLYSTTEENVAEAKLAIQNIKRDEFYSLTPSKYAKRKPRKVETFIPGWIQCPGCSRKFSLSDPNVWDGTKHLSCGQKIIPTGQLKALPPRKWWQFWKK